MEDLELLARLQAHEVFGVSMIQRIAGFGYQRAVDTISRLEAAGSIKRDETSTQWRLTGMRAALHSLYEQHKRTLQNLTGFPPEVVQPLILMDVPDAWTRSANRVLVVGQETLGWDFKPQSGFDWPYPPIVCLEDFLNVPDSVEAMMHGYRVFEFSRYQPENINSPFWRAYRQIRTTVGDDPAGFDTRVIHTNLFKTAVEATSVVKNGSVEEADNIWRASFQLLSREIEILQPDAVIFFTGPDYDRYLELEFPGLQWNPASGHSQRELSRLVHHSLPEKSFRTYHPGYLSRGNWHLLDDICTALS